MVFFFFFFLSRPFILVFCTCIFKVSVARYGPYSTFCVCVYVRGCDIAAAKDPSFPSCPLIPALLSFSPSPPHPSSLTHIAKPKQKPRKRKRKVANDSEWEPPTIQRDPIAAGASSAWGVGGGAGGGGGAAAAAGPTTALSAIAAAAALVTPTTASIKSSRSITNGLGGGSRGSSGLGWLDSESDEVCVLVQKYPAQHIFSSPCQKTKKTRGHC